uniref:Aminotransferase-like plant mobile domain-containing protein n=1 Tax=Fagus sylvatica TaxID=28930 RepID=A0A2N9I300_FAGSY
MKGRGGSSSGKGGSPGGARVPRESGDDSSGSDSILGSPEPHGDILGRPTVDPWYRSGERFPSVPASLQPPSPDWEWLVIREDSAADMAWTPNFREIRDLQIQRNEMLAVPLVFDFQCSRAVEWADWIDSELADRGFCDRLEQAGVLRSILISRCSNMFRDTEALRQLDVENHWLLPILGDQDPAEITLSPEESKIEAVLADYIGRKNVALGTQAARFNSWMEHFLRIEDPLIRRAAFISYWLSKCVFGEHPAYSIKPLYFCLAVKIAAGVRFPLAPLLLGQLYTQLDLLHAEELAGASCHIVSTAFNSSVVHTFVWEHALEYIRKGKKPYEIRKKFASMPEGVVTNVGDFQGDVPAVFRWVGNKFYDHSLIPSLDSEGKVCWRPYGITHRGFVYESVMSGFRDVEAQDYTLIAGDVASLTYLSATNAGWVRRQFGFDQEVPAVMGVAAGEIPTINPFLRARAFAYWSSVAPRVIVPNGNRIGVFTAGMANYWRGLMAAMVEFRDSGRRDISHLLESYTSPLPSSSFVHSYQHHDHLCKPPKLRLCRCHLAGAKEMFLPALPLLLRGSNRIGPRKGETVSKDSPAQASKRVKTTAGRVSKEALVLKTAVQDPVPADETAAEEVSAPVSKKPVRKTRAGKKTFVPPAFPSAPASIAARVAARKSGRGIVYSEKRSKQRADTAARVPVEISDDLSSTSSSSGEDDVSGAAAEEAEDEDVEAATAEETEKAVSGAGDFTADISSPDIGSLDTDAIINASSEEKDVEAGASIEDDEVSMGELGATGAASDSGSTASASKDHVCRRAVTSSGGTVQGDISESGSHVDPSLLDSSPSTRQYVRRARRGSLVSTDSERTASVTARVPTPPSPLGESGGTAPTPIITTAVVSAAATVQGDETAPVITEEVPGHEEVLVHTPEVPGDMARVEPAEVAASEEPVQADVTPGSGVPVIEEELAQDPVDDVDMADTHDSYDEAWADAEDNMAGDQAADMEVTAPVAAQTSPTRTARSSRGTVIEEEGRLAGCSSGVLPLGVNQGCCLLQDLQHQELLFLLIWMPSSENLSADFEVFRVPRGGIRFLKALWEKYGSCSSYFSRGVHFKRQSKEVSNFGFILDYLRRLARDIFSRRVLAELREAEARVAALRDALNAVAPSPWDLASARRASAEARTESALQGLLS